MRTRAWLGLFASLFMTFDAHAQGGASDTTAARALFDKGVELMEKGKLAEACPHIDEAMALSHGIGATLLSGQCHEQAGHMATAWARFNSAADLAHNAKDATREAEALAGVQRVAPKRGFLELKLAPWYSTNPHVAIKRNGEPIPRGLWTSPIPVDAGVQALTVEAPGFAELTASTGAIDGKTVPVELSQPKEVDRQASPPTPSASAPARAPSSPSPSAPAPDEARPVWPWVTLGFSIGAAGGVIATAVGWADTASTYSDCALKGEIVLCRPADASPGDVFDETGLKQEATRLENLRAAYAGLTIGLGAASVGLAIATGVGLASGTSSPSRAALVLPWVAPEGAGIAAFGSF